PAPLASTTQQAIPEDLERIVAKALRKDVGERYQTIDEFASDLRQLRLASNPRTGIRKQTLAIAGSVILLVVLAAVAGVWWLSRPTSSATPAQPPVATKPERRLVYWLLVQKYRDGKPYQDPFTPAADINFEEDYQVRLQLRNEQPGYLYVLSERLVTSPDSPIYIILFPSPTANAGQSRIEANQQLHIPEESWFRFDEKRGTEKVWLVWSTKSVPVLESIKYFANPRDRGVVNSAELNAAVRDFLTTHSDPPPIAERDAGQKEVV